MRRAVYGLAANGILLKAADLPLDVAARLGADLRRRAHDLLAETEIARGDLAEADCRRLGVKLPRPRASRATTPAMASSSSRLRLSGIVAMAADEA